MSILSNPKFINLFLESQSIGPDKGMIPILLESVNSSLTTYSKTHSYGEYIFDWAWADAFKRHKIPYYPKLTSMLPYTPATVSHFIGPQSQWDELLRQHNELLKNHSSSHFLFTTNVEQDFLGQNGFLLRDSFQYHFFNEDYKDFDHFLSFLKSKKAKTIKKERDHQNLVIQRFTGNQLVQDHALEMYALYLNTTKQKNAIAYLTKDFFINLFKNFSHNTLFIRAQRDDQLIAGSMFYYDEDKIYGRYWGCFEHIQNLHFELCYYQGIDFCIEKKLSIFEAGAQGEHKIARGFKPTLTTSAHKINHTDFHQAIAEYIKDERQQVNELLKELTLLLPFKD